MRYHVCLFAGLAADGGGNDSAKSMEKLYNIWPPNARSNSDSGGPSSLSSTHNMWAVHKQANGVSALWNPQPSEPIPDSLQVRLVSGDQADPTELGFRHTEAI